MSYRHVILVDVGGYRLHLHSQGAIDPAVIFYAGQGTPGLAWANVQPEVTAFARAVVYDRAGLGWSEPSPRPRANEVMVEELRTPLRNAGITGPYVLVGHSLDWHSGLAAELPVPTGAIQAAGGGRQSHRSLAVSSGKSLATSSAEIQAVQESHAQIRALHIQSLGDVPLIVIRHGQVQVQMMREVTELMEEVNERLQAQTAGQSSSGKLIVAERSGHDVVNDEPELIVEAIREVVVAARARLDGSRAALSREEPATISAIEPGD